MKDNTSASQTTDRREFLKAGTALTLGAMAAQLGVAHGAYAAENNTLKVGLVGCGGRGTGAAAQALTADPNTELVAMADAVIAGRDMKQSVDAEAAREAADEAAGEDPRQAARPIRRPRETAPATA